MLTTLSIISLDQGKFAPRYDLEPKSAEEAAEDAVCRMELAPRQAGQTLLAIWKGLSGRFGRRTAGSLAHAQIGATMRS